MFSTGTLTQRYNEAKRVRLKTKRVAKICGIIYMFGIGVLMLVAVFASDLVENGVTTGAVILAISGFPVGYLTGYIFGSYTSWTYYWLENKNAPIVLTLFLAVYVGLPVWLKYRKYDVKLQKMLDAQE